MQRVMIAAKKLRVRVVGAHLRQGLLGFYDKKASTIYFEISLSADERRCVVAHEIGHVFHGHDCTSVRNEEQADAFAARLLVDPYLYAEAEGVSSDVNYIADELGVGEDIIRAFQKHSLQRLGAHTYVRPSRMLVA